MMILVKDRLVSFVKRYFKYEFVNLFVRNLN